VTSHAVPRSYSIKETAALTGLPASTLRYYEQVGVITPISRGASSKHRVYDEGDLDRLMAVSCLAATGMSLSDMRQYMANAEVGPSAAADQRRLLEEQRHRLAVEAEALALRERYVELKIAYWRSVEDGDEARTEEISAQAAALADELRQVVKR
jgi:DNA-binding transcriptional MerR regulator